MKKIICCILILSLTFSFSLTPRAENVVSQDESKPSVYSKQLFDYLISDTGKNSNKYIVNRENFKYMEFVKNFRSNTFAEGLLSISGKVTGMGNEPDKEKYMEVLISIIATCDMEGSEAVSEQYRMDNLKSAKDYAIDIVEIGAKAATLMVGLDSHTSELEQWISTAIGGLTTLEGNINAWIDSLSNLEAIIQDYSSYDSILAIIETNSSGELKSAASELRHSMMNAVKIELDEYNSISESNFKNYEHYFFSGLLFQAVKSSTEYENDSGFRFFVDCSDNIVSKLTGFLDAWDIGKVLGILIGDTVVGGEDLINRTLELKANYDISCALQQNLTLSSSFLNAYQNQSNNANKLASEYVSYFDFISACRIRGEYCLYSIIVKDAKLLSWAHKENASAATTWYESQTDKILKLKEALHSAYETVKEVEKDVDTSDNSIISDDSRTKETSYQEFLIDKLYLNQEWEFPPTEYAILDINQDGSDELIVLGLEVNMGFSVYRVYLFDGTVKPLSCDRMSIYNEFNEGDMTLFNAYGVPAYSKKYKALTATYPRPTIAGGEDTFFELGSSGMKLLMCVQFLRTEPNYEETYYSKYDAQGIETSLSEEEYNSIIAEPTSINFQALP